MNNLIISQTEPISSLPKDYSRLLKRAKQKKEPIVFLRRNKPVGALVDWEWLKKAQEAKRQLEEKVALSHIAESEKEFEKGKAKLLESLKSLSNGN